MSIYWCGTNTLHEEGGTSQIQIIQNSDYESTLERANLANKRRFLNFTNISKL